MTTEDFLSQLEGVRTVGRGWKAKCIAHADQTPSLSIHEGDSGILVRCWAGCTVEEITAAMGLTVADLFFETTLPRHERQRAKVAPIRRRYEWRAFSNALYFKALDFRLRSHAVLSAARGLDIRTWTDADLDTAMRVACQARRNLERADRLDELDVFLCAHGLEQEATRK